MVCTGSVARPHVVALIPVRDEQWTLRRCLATASVWADHIIVADQQSRDRSVEIARSFPKVVLIENNDREFSEVSRQRQLIAAAREHCAGPRVLIGIDADEILSANVVGDERWEHALRSAPGTMLRLNWIVLASETTYLRDVARDAKRCVPFGYIDDGFAHEGARIHTTRVPEPPGAPAIDLPHIAVLHYNLLNRDRSDRKNRWYQCFERVQHPPRDVVEVRRRYDWVDRQPASTIRAVRPEWFEGWRARGIELASESDIDFLWCDFGVVQFFAKHGTRPFRFLDLWSIDWEAVRLRGRAENIEGIGSEPIVPPMHAAERLMRWLLARKPPNRWGDAVLRRVCRLMDSWMSYDLGGGAAKSEPRVESHG